MSNKLSDYSVLIYILVKFPVKSLNKRILEIS